MRIKLGWNENEIWGQIRVILEQAENWFEMNIKKKKKVEKGDLVKTFHINNK